MVNCPTVTRKMTRNAAYHDHVIYMSEIQFAFYKFLEYLTIFLIGGVVYVGIEIAFRGYSHISMMVLGGLCLVIVGLLNEVPCFPKHFGIIPQAIMGAVIITILEFITGLIVNVWLGLDVWDYSNMPLNIMGQICLPFTLAWVLLSIVAIVVDDYIRHYLFGEPKPSYSWWTYDETKAI